jgi:limonene-1,2-epoxide hydrolase
MIDRRTFVTAIGSGSVALAWSPTAESRPRKPDYFGLFLDVISSWKRHDVDKVLAHLADDIVWYAYVGAPPIVGKAEIRKLLTQLAPHRAAERWRIFNHAVNDTQLLLEGVDDYDDDKGNRIAVPYMGIVEFRDRLIVGWRDYFDVGLLNRMKAGEPVPAAVEPLVARKGRP